MIKLIRKNKKISKLNLFHKRASSTIPLLKAIKPRVKPQKIQEPSPESDAVQTGVDFSKTFSSMMKGIKTKTCPITAIIPHTMYNAFFKSDCFLNVILTPVFNFNLGKYNYKNALSLGSQSSSLFPSGSRIHPNFP